jgi:hypothetical protein
MWPLVLRNTVGCNVPHLGIRVLDILLHAKPSCCRRILAVSHAAKFLQIGLDILTRMRTSISWAGTFLAATLQLGFRFVAVAYIGTTLLYQFLGEII